MRAIAREAGVSHMAPYHHFADKAALIAAVAEEGFRVLTEEMSKRIAARGDDPRAALRASGIAYVVFAVTRPHLFRVMFGAEVAGMSGDDYPGLSEAGSATFAVLQGQVERSQDEGTVRQADSRSIGLTAWSLVHGLAMLIIDGHFGPEAMHPEGAEQLAYEVTGGVYRGLRESE
jgi:AcrR family transcriptional regulator